MALTHLHPHKRARTELTHPSLLTPWRWIVTGAIWHWAGCVPLNGPVVIAGLKKERRRKAQEDLDKVNKEADKHFKHAQEQLKKRKADDKEFFDFLAACPREAIPRGVSKYYHFHAHRGVTDRKAVALQAQAGGTKCGQIVEVIKACVTAAPQLFQPAVKVNIDGHVYWQLPDRVPLALAPEEP